MLDIHIDHSLRPVSPRLENEQKFVGDAVEYRLRFSELYLRVENHGSTSSEYMSGFSNESSWKEHYFLTITSFELLFARLYIPSINIFY